MGNSNQSCNQCSCQSSTRSPRKSSKSSTDCCAETTCITIETTGRVGLGTSVPDFNLCVTDSCNTDSCNTDSCNTDSCNTDSCNTDSCNTGVSRRAQRLARRRSRRGR